MSQKPMVDIILPTFNGGQYLKRLLDSLLEQSYTEWRLLARDDGSIDDTVQIIDQYCGKFPGRISIVPGSSINQGIFTNLQRILEHSEAEYVMLADQDDVWLPNKISKSLSVIEHLSRKNGAQIPLLVYSDLKVVNSEESLLADSFWGYQGLNPDYGLKISSLLVWNVVLGCTTIFNRSLVQLALPFPKEAISHDWWLALVAAACGKSDYFNETLILYRQHSSNTVGARRWCISCIIERLRNFKQTVRDMKSDIIKSQIQADALLARGGRFMDEDTYHSVATYGNLFRYNFLIRRFISLRFKYCRSGLTRNIAFYLFL